MEINGVAHVILTVRDMERARPFYGIRLEVNYVPGKGLLEPGARFGA